MRFQMFSEHIARWSVLLLCASLPFFFIPTAWISVIQAKMLLVVVLVIVAITSWIIVSFLEGVIRIPRSSLILAALLVPIAYLISAFATGASRASFIGSGVGQDTVVATLIWYALFVGCANILAAGTGRLVMAARMILQGGAAVLVIQILHLVFPSFTFGGVLVGQTASVIGNWHDLGIFLGLLFFLSLVLLPTSVAASRRWKILLITTAAASAMLLLVVNFRDIWLGLCILSAAYGAYLWYASRPLDEDTQHRLVRRSLYWIVIAAVFLGLYFAGSAVHSVLPSAFQVTQLEVRPSWQGTFTVGSRVFAEPNSIFFGSGPNTFPREWGMYKPLSVNATQFWNIDFYSGVGFIPTSFVTVGLLGAVAWGAVCLALFTSMWRFVRRRMELSGASILRAGFVGAAVYLTAFHVLYVPGPALSTLTFILFGAVVAGEILAGSTRDWTWSLSLGSWKGRIGIAVTIIFGIAILFGGIQSMRAIFSDMFINRAVVVYSSTRDLASASRQAAKALAILPTNDRAHRAAVELGMLQFTELVSSGDASEAARTQLQNTLTETIQHGLTAVAIESSDYQNWLSLARLYGELAGVGVEGAGAAAQSAYLEAQKNNPTNPLPLLGLAQISLLSGDDASARGHLTVALEIKPDFAAALFLLSQIDARAGDLDAARANAEAVVRSAPDDALGWYNLGTIYYVGSDYENASAAFERAVGVQNDYANALFLLSASYVGLGRFEEAITALRAVASLNPSQESLLDMIASLEVGENPFASP